jgi:transposase
MALHRAALNGFALIEHQRDEFWTCFLRVGRFRRTLIHAAAKLRTRSHHLLDAYLPGFIDRAFPDFWNNNCAWPIAAAILSPQEILTMGEDGLARLLRDQGIRFHRRSLAGILTWAAAAPAPDVAPENARRLALALQREREQKTLEIRAFDIDLAQLLCRTPYVLMLSCPGLNVPTVADIAAELGPIRHYASAKSLTGRAGLWPTRHQSGQVDRRGSLVRCANRKLRAALLRGADSLLRSNPHFLDLGTAWKKAGEDPHRRVVKVANHLCRILYQMVAGQQVFAHPQCQERHWILDKLIAFHAEHDSDAQVTERDLDAAVAQLPTETYAAEAEPLRERLEALQRGRAKDPQGLAATLPKVLARMGVSKVESKESGGRATADRKG